MPGFSNSERLSFYAHIRTLESDFDKSQSQLRTIAAAWSGGVIAALALTTVAIANTGLSTSPPKAADIAVAKESLFYVREFVCIVGSLGIFAFWYVDQSVYQRLLHSAFAYGLYLEYENNDLPQVRSSLYWANLDITGRLGTFYRMQFWAFVVLSGFFLVLSHEILTYFDVHTVITSFLGYFLVALMLEKLTWNWASLDKTVERLYPQTLWPNLPRRGADPNDQVTQAWLTRIREHPVPPAPPGQQA